MFAPTRPELRVMLPYYHPTTLLVVDDDPLFLDSFAYHYGDRFLVATCKSPEAAIALLREPGRQEVEASAFVGPVGNLADYADAKPGNHLLHLRPGRISELVTRENRFSIVSVIVVDYAMPSMTGLEFCRATRDVNAKKLLLTGKTGENTAVAAFNEGLIDLFMMKQDREITDKLPREIKKLERAYFEELTAPLRAIASFDEGAFLNDSNFVAWFENLCERLEIVEYYLAASPTGVLLFDAEGAMTTLIVCSEDRMRAQLETAVIADGPSKLIARLRKGDAILWCPTESGFFEERFTADWQEWLLPGEQIMGNQKWVVADTHNILSTSMDPKRVTSLHDYRMRAASMTR